MIYVALFGWPVVVAILFSRQDVPRATAAAILGGYLLLPHGVGYNLPVLPTYNKNFAASLSAIIAITLIAGSRRPNRAKTDVTGEAFLLPGWIPHSKIVLLGLAMIVVGSFATALTNTSSLNEGGRILRGLSIYDAGSMVLSAGVALLPFLLGRRVFAMPHLQRLLLAAFAIAAALYGILALYEIRMSPQLSRQVYGFFPHSWTQHVRGGGYRPVVFLQHALWLAIFLAMGFLASLSLALRNTRHRTMWFSISLLLLLTLILGKSLGAFMLALAFGAALLFGGAVRIPLIISAATASLVLVYPMMRGADLVPINSFVSKFESIDATRASSFSFRLRNEDMLLEKANQKPLFGWGGYARARVYDQEGRDLSVTDGEWVITIGEVGWIGYLGKFGLLCLPIVALFRHRKTWNIGPETVGLCAMLSINLIDLIPNATLTPLTWLIAGALVGRVEVGAVEDQAPKSQERERNGMRAPSLDLGAAARETRPRTGIPRSGSVTARQLPRETAAETEPTTETPALDDQEAENRYTRQTRLHVRRRPDTAAAPKTNRKAPS
ncbi:Lipid A core-O-antigen ligase [Jannaschia seosinensis]|uniref:Lipid A core-O-antigen ligase n=1 Tax=Jannaschia seosinensis TaxID=313367 RepID=A0A0M7B989_9RHOB|nr:hypothetical protein [Jannaschia seosinensis]CUH20695.1 Lipid A core-O-antigen ligase [Jannaschia seosinensis]